jgi:hypothetical protein
MGWGGCFLRETPVSLLCWRGTIIHRVSRAGTATVFSEAVWQLCENSNCPRYNCKDKLSNYERNTTCKPREIRSSLVLKKSCPSTRHGGAWGERRYSSYSFTTSALDGGEWSASRPCRALPQGKDPRYALYRRLGGPQSRSGYRG